MFKTTTAKTAQEYIDLLVEPVKTEIEELHKMIRKTVPKLEPFIISGMIGYGKVRYKSKSGREGDWYIIGLAPQKNYISVYICPQDGDWYLAEKHKADFPKASIGRSCIRFKKITDIDLEKLKKLIMIAAK